MTFPQCSCGVYRIFRCLCATLPVNYKTAALPLSYASLRGISPTYVRDVNRRGGSCAQIVPEESARRVLNIGLVHDRIALIDIFSLMSADLHRH
jgi:hypothetical protein